MISTINATPHVPKYPYIGKMDDFIVLFTGPDTGTLLVAKGSYSVGRHATSWSESGYTPFQGSITLAND